MKVFVVIGEHRSHGPDTFDVFVTEAAARDKAAELVNLMLDWEHGLHGVPWGDVMPIATADDWEAKLTLANHGRGTDEYADDWDDERHRVSILDQDITGFVDHVPALIRALTDIKQGSEPTGVWRDARGDECDEGDEGARFEEYNAEEQRAWLDSVAHTAEAAIAQAQSGAT